MPVNVPDNLPAIEILRKENIFVMTQSRAIHQDIRPLQIMILNLMPVKATTETHLLRMLSNSPLQVEVTLIHTNTHTSRNTSQDHLANFYSTFESIKHKKFDGLIITGAPIEHLDFEEVDYWSEITEILLWAKKNVTSTLHICWAAQAGLYFNYGIQKHPLASKMFGIYKHTVLDRTVPIVRGFDDEFMAPHSRHTEIRREDIIGIPELKIISESDEAGVYLVESQDQHDIFVTGHSEYDPFTLKDEYERDLNKGLPIEIPKNYFPNNDPSKMPEVYWRSHASLLFSNWLNYYVYQATPYKLEE